MKLTPIVHVSERKTTFVSEIRTLADGIESEESADEHLLVGGLGLRVNQLIDQTFLSKDSKPVSRYRTLRSLPAAGVRFTILVFFLLASETLQGSI